MDLNEHQKKFAREAAYGKKEGFDVLMRDLATKYMLSKLPPSEDLEIILKHVFERGFDCGGGIVTFSLLKSIMKASGNEPF